MTRPRFSKLAASEVARHTMRLAVALAASATEIAMYIPDHFKELRPEHLHAFVRAHALATIVVTGAEGISANHIPLSLRPNEGANGQLVGHVSRANPLWKEAGAGVDCLAIFHGTEHYISPNGFATKQIDGKVVPTWNYEVVHVRGSIRAVDNAKWLRSFLEEFTNEHEASQSVPWRVDDAPSDFVEIMVRGIVGVVIDIDSIVGKAKLNQNLPPQNQTSIVEKLRGVHEPNAQAMANAIERACDDSS